MRILLKSAFIVFAFASLSCNRSTPTEPVMGSAVLVGTVTAVAADGSRAPLGGAWVSVEQCIPGTATPEQLGFCSSAYTGNAVSTADGTYSITTLYYGAGNVYAGGTSFATWQKHITLPAGTTHLDIELVRVP